MMKDFKEFILRGNVLDLAVGVIIGGAFGKIVASLTADILMPPIGLLLGKVDFKNLYIDLSGKTYLSLDAAQKAGAPTINYGVFINTLIDFLIIAFVIFLVVKQVNKFMPKPVPAPAPAPSKDCPRCLSAIPVKATRCAFCTSDVAA